MTRDERQELARQTWIKNKCKGCFVQPTGAGKTVCALKCLKSLKDKYPDMSVLIVVPTDNLKEQWTIQLDEWGLLFSTSVEVINTVVKSKYTVDVLILDEIHRYAAETFQQVFLTVRYRYILGLTATFERLDGKHELLRRYCPVIDVITQQEALVNGWVAPYKEYLVLIDVDDIDTYKEYNREFQQHFEYFDYDFGLAMSCIGKDGFINRAKLRDKRVKGDEDERKRVFTEITYHATAFIRSIQKRKAFINNHPKKIEIARQIISMRPNSRIITFSNNIKMAESIGMGGKVYSGKDSKKKGRITLEEFQSGQFNLIHTAKKLDEGADLKGLSVAIILGLDSSEIKSTQRRGRCIRKEGDKTAEIFNIVINNTIETSWFKNGHKSSPYITVSEEGLVDVLEGRVPQPYYKKIRDYSFRY